MKVVKIVIVFALISFGLQQANAQNPDAKITITKVVDVSVDKMWGTIRDLDNLAQYSSVIAKVDYTGENGAGGVRVCTTPDGQGKFKENILAFDDVARTYTYAVVEGVPAMGLINNFKVVDLGFNKSMVVWTSGYDKFMTNPNMTEEQFLGFMRQSVGEIMDKMAIASAK